MHYNFSFWEYDSFFRDIDVAIIGSGIVGLSAAIRLKKSNPNLKVVVLERGPLPIGASTRNAGFACIGSMTEILDDLKTQSEDQVFSLVQKRYEGLRLLRETLGDDHIQYSPCGGYELFGDEDEEEHEKCLDKISYFNKILKDITGAYATFKDIDPKSTKWKLKGINKLIINDVEGSIHTGSMMKSLTSLAQEVGVQIYCGVNIDHLDHHHDHTDLIIDDHRKVQSKKVIIATNGFAKSLLKSMDISPARNQILLTSEIPNLQLNGTFHYLKGYVYFRNVGSRVLIGGYRHIDPIQETTEEFGQSAIIQDALLSLLNETILPDHSFQIAHRWSGIMGVGASKAPIVQKINDHCVAAVRLGGMGVAIGSLVGKEAADLLIGE